ncbi:hypothetical protein DL93DRAFT_633624 [Clavulina sp. PMI_390]|nr:hypothetical protein DL93DRAFT_633624 [Clavulina sp. PMI_390]
MGTDNLISVAGPTANFEWLSRLPFDIFEQVIALLDAYSLLQLTHTCNRFRDSFLQDSVLWGKLLRGFAIEHCLAPHSFSHPKFASPQAVIRLTSRPRRIIEAVSNQNTHLQIRHCSYNLELQSLFQTSQPVGHVGGILLPGGRWYLSLATLAEDKPSNVTDDMQIFCWDVLAAVDGNMQPVAHAPLKLPGRPGPIKDIMKVQLYEDEKSVLIVCISFADRISTRYRVGFPSVFSLHID